MTNIAICGANGRMGHNIFNCAAEREDCTVVAGIDIYTKQYADFPIVETPAQLPVKPDVIIDFSNPASLDGLLDYCLSTGTPIVIGATGYTDEQTAKIKAAAQQIPVFFTYVTGHQPAGTAGKEGSRGTGRQLRYRDSGEAPQPEDRRSQRNRNNAGKCNKRDT